MHAEENFGCKICAASVTAKFFLTAKITQFMVVSKITTVQVHVTLQRCVLYAQLWARAYRDQTYHAAINTTNGVESQNKLLKYSYLPRRKNITLSQLAAVLYEEFIPETHHKYLYLNYQMSGTYRRYNDFVPVYLLERPREVIIHCLERKSSSRKYVEDDILTTDITEGKFTIQGSSKVHTVDFGTATSKPSCTCPDWLQWHLPCKHFFAIFHLVEGWGWDALPETYKRSAYLCADSEALSEQHNPLSTADEAITKPDTRIQHEVFTTPLQDALPTKKVRV